MSNTDGLFLRAMRGEAVSTPPIWLMRQAGRYHAPYQQLRARHSFETLCRQPELAAEVAMGPVLDFDFDAAILFSDLLFPLEALGFGLSYDAGPPKLDGSLTLETAARFRSMDEALGRLAFQGAAMRETRARLPSGKGLIGFVGGPWTLFVYAVEGTHAGRLERAKSSLDLYRVFADRMTPLLIENIRLQFDAGADVVMIFDTAAGELSPETFQSAVADDLAAIMEAFPGRLGYYAKGFRPEHLGDRDGGFMTRAAGLGVDMNWNLAAALTDPSRKGFLQGNFDPVSLQLTGSALDEAIDRFLSPLRPLDAERRRGWICGLGHGVLPGTPEQSVRTFVSKVREAFP